MDISQIITHLVALGGGAIILKVITAVLDRHKDKATAAKTLAEAGEVYSRIGIAQVEESRKSADRAWEIANRYDKEAKEAKAELKRKEVECREELAAAADENRRMQQELNEALRRSAEKDGEIDKLKNQLKQYQPHGRSPRTPEG